MKTHIAVVLDKSGSMSNVVDETISGFNDYLASLQKDEKHQDMLMTLTLFDTALLTPIVAEPVDKVLSLDKTRYVPSGFTALNDAIVSTVKSMTPKVAKDDRAIVVIITDGQENSSKDATKKEVLELISRKEGEGNWTFTYLSAAPSAFADAQAFGICNGNVAAYANTSTGTQAAFKGLSVATMCYTSSTLNNSKRFYTGSTGNFIDDPARIEPMNIKSQTGWVTGSTVSNSGDSGKTAWIKES